MTTKTWFASGAVLIIVIALGVYAAHGTAPVADASLVSNGNALLLPNQPSSSDTVVPYVKLSQPGFVIVYTTTTTTQTKQVLGTSDLLSAGEHRNVHVHHDNGAKPADGSAISATIVADNGDGTYTAGDDTQTLLPDDQQPTADISDDAVVDDAPTDEQLAAELSDAGYDVNQDAVVNDDTVPSADDATAPTEDTTSVSSDTDDAATSSPDMTEQQADETPAAATSTDDIEAQAE